MTLSQKVLFSNKRMQNGISVPEFWLSLIISYFSMLIQSVFAIKTNYLTKAYDSAISSNLHIDWTTFHALVI